MDLALQLSQQEASVTALQLQRREEADVMKAIEESVSTDLSQLELKLSMGHKHLFFSREQNREHSVGVYCDYLD